MSYCIQAHLSEYGRYSYLTKILRIWAQLSKTYLPSKIIHFKIRVNHKKIVMTEQISSQNDHSLSCYNSEKNTLIL